MKRKLLIPVLAFLCVPFIAGCNPSNVVDGVEFEVEEEKKGPRLLDGAIDSIQIGESIILNEIIDTSLSDDFTVKIVSPSGKEIDGNRYLDRPYKPSDPGEYKIVYTIKSGKDKGTETFPLNVVVKKIKWSYTLQNKPYLYNETLKFEDYFNDLNSFVDSYYPYKFVMDSVLIDDVETNLHEKTEYKIQSMSDHLFKFHVETDDGQKIDASENISIKFINQNYLEEIKSKNIDLYGELLVGDMNDPNDKSITLKRGQYNNGSTNFLSANVGPHDLPYMVLNDVYGIGDLVKIDFTGNNMPIMSFFRDDNYSNNVFDESKGCVISNGFYNNLGGEVSPAVSARISQYGPYMLYGYCDRDFLGDSSSGTIAKPFGGSSTNLSKLNPNNKYRLLCGFTGISKDVPNKNTYLTHNFALLDLTNHMLLGKYEVSSYSINKIGYQVRGLPESAYDFPIDWFKGKIVLYGNYGKTTKIDKCPEVVSLEGRTFDKTLEEECQYISSVFEPNAPTNLTAGKEYDPSIFGDITKSGSKVFITDSNGSTVPLVEGKIKINNSGIYKANYTDGTNYVVSKDIYVTSNEAEKDEDDNVLYNATKNLDDSYTLNKGMVTDGGTNITPSYLTANDLSYVMLKDDYGINDYLSVDFTGNNMPVMTFFRDENNISGSLFDNSKGVVVMGGLSKGDGTYASPEISSSIRMYGPTLFYNYCDRDYLGDGSGGTPNNPFPGSQKYLEEHDEDTEYKVIVGFSAYNDTTHILTLQYRLLDMTNRQIIGSFSANSYNIHAIGTDIRHLNYSHINSDYFNGKIALYGNYGKSLTIDSFEVNHSDDIDKIVTEIYHFVPSEFKTTAPTFIDKNTAVEASLFGDLTHQDSYVYIVSEDGQTKIETVNGTLTVPNSGNYNVVYNDGVHIDAIKSLYVSDLSTKREENVYSHGATIDGDQITLASGYIGNGANYTGPNKSGTVDQAFIGYDGNYKLDTFIELEFTGKNLPEIAFFANNYDNSMYESNGGKEGIVVASGITDYKGDIASYWGSDTINYSGIHMIDDISQQWFTGVKAFTTSNLNRAKLVDETRYKLLIGFVAFGASALDLQWCLYNKDTSEIVEEKSLHTWPFFDGSYTQHDINYKKLEDFVGSIVLYGKFGTPTVVDKCSIHESKTLSGLKTELGIN